MRQSSNPLHTNRLSRETSPYLLQHQHNPVDWHAWGPEAFERARAENKPIFLSVGYSTCYWCHVMERQSFENESIAAVMNQHFICIKVDREERPDVDQLYMTAVQLMTRQGGWPMSVWLTPDLRPFYGGTYFPPADAHGRMGFPRLCQALADAWKNRPAEVEASATQLTEHLRDLSGDRRAGAVLIDVDFIDSIIDRSTSDYEPQFGGFGHAPKFPRETLLELLLQTKSKSEKSKVNEMLAHTLDAMAAGGIRDHLGGGFHRYSTDGQWLVPHFEIMLYDNAMLAWVYTEAAIQFGNPAYADVARGIFDFTLREMTSPDGAFYTALDAEVDAQEGLSYLWTQEEIELLLGSEDARCFNRVYGVDSGPNFADPHHGTGRPDKSILFLPRAIEASAQQLGTDPAELNHRLVSMRDKLKSTRDHRKQPLLDTKIITSWNALMIRALAHAGRALNEPRYTAAATSAARFLLDAHRRDDGAIYRTSRGGEKKYLGFLDDYSFLADGLLELGMRSEAETIVRQMIERFSDPAGGFFFSDASADDLIVRQKTASDSPLPSGNAVAARGLLRLGHDDLARGTLAAFAAQLDQFGEGMSSMVQAADEWVSTRGAIVIDSPAATNPRDEPVPVVAVLTARSGAMISLKLQIAPGMHLNSNDAQTDLTPTRVTVANIPDAAVRFPPATVRKFEYSDEAVAVFDGEIEVKIDLHERFVDQPVRVRIDYQACSDSACQAPAAVVVDVPA